MYDEENCSGTSVQYQLRIIGPQYGGGSILCKSSFPMNNTFKNTFVVSFDYTHSAVWSNKDFPVLSFMNLAISKTKMKSATLRYKILSSHNATDNYFYIYNREHNTVKNLDYKLSPMIEDMYREKPFPVEYCSFNPLPEVSVSKMDRSRGPGLYKIDLTESLNNVTKLEDGFFIRLHAEPWYLGQGNCVYLQQVTKDCMPTIYDFNSFYLDIEV